MKKLLFGLLLILCLSSCEEGFRTQKIDNNSQVEITYSDSTKWENAKVYIVNDDKMYVRLKSDTYKVKSDDRILIIIVLILFFALFISVMIIQSL